MLRAILLLLAVVPMWAQTTLNPPSSDATAEELQSLEQSARAVIMENPVLAHKLLGWVRMARRQYDEARKEFGYSLEAYPDSAEILYWLGSSLLSSRKQSEALFFYARSVQIDGPGALNPANRERVRELVLRLYTSMHGSVEGFDSFEQTVKTNALPPDGFKIPPPSYVELCKCADSKDAVWKGIRRDLEANGQEYFRELEGRQLPELRGRVASFTPGVISIAISDAVTPEVTLRIIGRLDLLPQQLKVGAMLDVGGAVPKSFTAKPFMLTMEATGAKVWILQ